ncbi:MAG: hypothetical protein C4527_20450 [Candidatus Omnitrophota bacterium]|jgi:alkaline phosphatase|nr:MAG: hypothetical protein C4527_20450 [Candidatus Omnitrophota bacterium]
MVFIVSFGFVVFASADVIQPKNVIIMIGDGMGFNHVEAGSYYRFGRSKGQKYWELTTLAMQTYSLNNATGYDPQKAHVDFNYVKDTPTDSAAAATALSTGYKTQNEMIGELENGDALPHIMEDAEALGKATGVLTTVYFSHATPAGFIAHDHSRRSYEEIAIEMIWKSKVDLIIGAGHPWFDDDGKQVGGFAPNRFATSLNYDRVGGEKSWKNLLEGKPAADADGDGKPDAWTVLTTREEINKLTEEENPGRILGVLPVYSTLQQRRSGDEHAKPFEIPLNKTAPTMVELVSAALHILSQDPDGFVLMAEGGAIDWTSHKNQSGRMIEEQIDFDRAVEFVIEWIEKNSSWEETLLVVTADHECGYLTGIGSDPLMLPLTNRGAGVEPGMEWHSDKHTNQLVPLFLKGVGSDLITKVVVGVDEKYGAYVDNTAIAHSLRSLWESSLPPKLTFLVKPYLQQADKDRITILWETNIPSQAEVRYGEATFHAEQANLSQVSKDASLKTLHEMTLQNLKEETNYFYQVVATDENGSVMESEVLSFKTKVRDDSAYSFAVFSDTQTNPSVWGRIAQLAWAERPHFAVHTGDIVGNGNDKTQWVEHFLNPGHVLMSRIPIYIILGNHDKDAPLYYAYIANPAPEYYYTFTYGNAQFFLLDSCRDVSSGSEIHTWLDRALSQSRSVWKFVVHHHPPYTSDENDYGDTYKELSLLGDPDVQPLIPLYEKHNVDMVVFGHIHDYERTWPLRNNRIDHQNGVVYIQTGGCGGGLENYAPTRSWFTKKVHRDHHFCLINIHENQLMFQAIDRNWNLFDTFTMEK